MIGFRSVELIHRKSVCYRYIFSAFYSYVLYLRFVCISSVYLFHFVALFLAIPSFCQVPLHELYTNPSQIFEEIKFSHEARSTFFQE